MLIKDLPAFQNRTRVLSCGPDETVYNAVVSMAKRRCGAIMVVDEKGKIAGVFTERDLLARVVANGHDIESIKASEFMSTEIETVTANDSVAHTMARMSHGRFRHVPVVDDNGDMIGVLSQTDFVGYTIREIRDNEK